MYWLIGLLITMIVVFLVLMSVVRVSISYVHEPDRKNCTIHMSLFKGLLKYSWELPVHEVSAEEDGVSPNSKTVGGVGKKERTKEEEAFVRAESIVQRAEEVKELVDSVYQMHRIIRHFLKRVRIEQFEWYSTIGTGDAATTGMFAGLLWTIKGGIIGVASQLMTFMQSPKIEVQPSFQVPTVKTYAECIISFRMGKVMLAAYQIVKSWKGRKQNVRTSNPGLDANGNGKY